VIDRLTPLQRDLAFGNVRVDAAPEILANKMCTLLSRSELRDLVDVRALDRSGIRIEEVFALAQRKDGGLTAAQLAWVLSQIQLGDDARIPGGCPSGNCARSWTSCSSGWGAWLRLRVSSLEALEHRARIRRVRAASSGDCDGL
jgi:hypothetical protein